MKKGMINASMIVIFIVSLYIVVFQGFGFPNISNGLDAFLRILLAVSVQVLIITNLKPIWIRLLPTVIAAGIALWGVYVHWADMTFGMYFVDYGTFLVGCALGWLVVKFNI